MKISIPFNFPDDNEEYSDCVFGKNYRLIITNHLEWLVKYQPKNADEINCLVEVMRNLREQIQKAGIMNGTNNQTQ